MGVQRVPNRGTLRSEPAPGTMEEVLAGLTECLNYHNLDRHRGVRPCGAARRQLVPRMGYAPYGNAAVFRMPFNIVCVFTRRKKALGLSTSQVNSTYPIVGLLTPIQQLGPSVVCKLCTKGKSNA